MSTSKTRGKVFLSLALDWIRHFGAELQVVFHSLFPPFFLMSFCQTISVAFQLLGPRLGFNRISLFPQSTLNAITMSFGWLDPSHPSLVPSNASHAPVQLQKPSSPQLSSNIKRRGGVATLDAPRTGCFPQAPILANQHTQWRGTLHGTTTNHDVQPLDGSPPPNRPTTTTHRSHLFS